MSRSRIEETESSTKLSELRTGDNRGGGLHHLTVGGREEEMWEAAFIDVTRSLWANDKSITTTGAEVDDVLYDTMVWGFHCLVA